VRTLNLGTLVAESGAVELRLPNADVRLESVQVTIDGRPATPERVGGGWRIDGLEVGARQIAVTHPDYEPWTQQVQVRDQQTAAVTVAMEPKPGILALAVQGASQYVLRAGGREVAVSGGQARLPAGQPLELELAAQGCKSARRTLTLPANGRETWSVALEKLRGADAGQPWTVPDLGLEMVWIAPGSFTMGSPDSEPGRESDEGPQTQVTLSRGCWLGKYEVTQAQWQALMGSNPSTCKNAGSNAPVEQVSWTDAMEFCRKLTERERAAGRLPGGYAYTLPTEAQWEYACRAGTTTPFHYGNALRSGMANFNGLCEYPPCGGDPHSCYNAAGTYLERTTAVGSYAPNAWGLFDMHGNGWEWCADWGGAYPGGSVTDPQGAPSGSFRAFRGGGWNFHADYCRSACRRGHVPGFRDSRMGFRVALVAVP
jgi:formylglycine-generating enzyme required for sulfatase activity